MDFEAVREVKGSVTFSWKTALGGLCKDNLVFLIENRKIDFAEAFLLTNVVSSKPDGFPTPNAQEKRGFKLIYRDRVLTQLTHQKSQ